MHLLSGSEKQAEGSSSPIDSSEIALEEHYNDKDIDEVLNTKNTLSTPSTNGVEPNVQNHLPTADDTRSGIMEEVNGAPMNDCGSSEYLSRVKFPEESPSLSKIVDDGADSSKLSMDVQEK
jgi:hypothetical protein